MHSLMRRAKPPKLSIDEKALLDRIARLSDEETEKLSTDEIIAYLNILDKIDPGAFRRALEDALIDRGLTNAEFFQLLIRAMNRAKLKQ
jgi:hypothetical protein